MVGWPSDYADPGRSGRAIRPKDRGHLPDSTGDPARFNSWSAAPGLEGKSGHSGLAAALSDHATETKGFLSGKARSDRSAMYRSIGIGVGVAAVLGIALRPVLVKLVYVDLPDPITLLALQMGFILPLFVGIAVWDATYGNNSSVRRRDLLLACLTGLICYHTATVLIFFSLQYISAGIAPLFGFLYPTIVTVLSKIFLGKPILFRHVAALVISYGGVAMVLSVAFDAPNNYMLIGAALVISAAMLHAVYLVSGSQLVMRVGAVRFTCCVMITACVAALVQFAVLRPLPVLILPTHVYVLAAIMALASTALPMLLIGEALRRIGANHYAIIGALGPVSTIVIGYIVLGETMTVFQIVGAALVVGGVLLTTYKSDI